MKLNVISVLNAIESENASVENNYEIHPYEGRTDLDWIEEYELNCWKKAREERRKATSAWAHVMSDIDVYYDQWLHEKSMSEYWNDLAARECDRLMWEGRDYSHIKFDKIQTFDEWMKKEMEIISKYMVA